MKKPNQKTVEDKLKARTAELEGLVAEANRYVAQAQERINQYNARSIALQGMIAELQEWLPKPKPEPTPPTDKKKR